MRIHRVLLPILVAGLSPAGAVRADEGPLRAYSLPAGEAEPMLRRFSDASGCEVLFASEAVRGVRTRPVDGRFTALAALERMLAGTDLRAVEDRSTGALAVVRSSPPPPPAARPSPDGPRDLPSPKTTHMNKPRRSTLRLLAGLAAVLGVARTGAQTAAPADPSSSDQTVVLSPFQVSSASDRGYRVRDIVTGSKIATPLDQSPITVGVIDQQLLEDTHLDRVTDAVAFTQAGIANMGRVYQDQEQFTLRGYPGEILRNGVPFNAWTDSVNIERIEIAQGPSAILYGFVSPGGVVNYVTKKPLDASFLDLRERWGSESGFREDLDLNAPLFEGGGNKVLFRLMGAETDGKTFLQYQTMHDLILNPVVAVDLGPKTTLTYDFQYRNRRGPFERIRMYYMYAGSGFLAFPFAPYNAQLGGAVGYDRNAGIAPWTKGYDTHRRTEIRLEHRFDSRFTFQAIASDDSVHVEELTEFSDFNTVRDPAYQSVYLPPPDHILLSIMPIYENYMAHNQYAEADFLARFDTGAVKSDTLVGTSETRSLAMDPAHNGYFAPVPSLIGKIDTTLQSPYTVRLSDPLSARFYLPPGDYHQWPEWFTSSNVYDWGKPDFFVTETLGALGGRLHAIGGLRREEYRDVQQSKILPQVGAIYELVKGLSVYGIYSKSAESNGLTLRYRTPRPLSSDSGYDAGFKFETKDGAFSGTLAYFDIRKSNLGVSDSHLVILYAQGLADDTYTFSPGSESKGFEANFQYQPSPSFQAIASYAHTRAVILPGDPNPVNWDAPLVYSVPDAATFYGKYRFLSGALRGLAVGAGFVKNWGPIYTDAFTSGGHGLGNLDGNFVVNAFVRYPVRILGHAADLEAACNNATDDRYIENGGWSPPREYFLSVETRF